PLAWRAVVAVTGIPRDPVKSVHRRVVGGGERHVEMLGRRAGHDRERTVAACERAAIGPLAFKREAGIGRDGLVEPPRRFQVWDSDPEVVDRPRAPLLVVD